jgi:hypothetical protein
VCLAEQPTAIPGLYGPSPSLQTRAQGLRPSSASASAGNRHRHHHHHHHTTISAIEQAKPQQEKKKPQTESSIQQRCGEGEFGGTFTAGAGSTGFFLPIGSRL